MFMVFSFEKHDQQQTVWSAGIAVRGAARDHKRFGGLVWFAQTIKYVKRMFKLRVKYF